jgi:nifR3 family TIM-barrel protein
VRSIPAVCEKAKIHPEDKPLSVQVYGNVEDPLPQASAWAVSQGATIIDINMGCPIDKVCKKNGGSLLLKTPGRTANLAKQIIDACDGVPVTAKVRLGWGENELTAPGIAKRLEDVGIAAITVHGRTTSQKFSGRSCLDGIAKVVEAVSIPVIGNGDINSPESAQQMFEHTKCAGVMVGRHSMKEPWIFQDITKRLQGETPILRDRNDKIKIILRHLELILEYRGERSALHCITNRIALYGRTLGHIKPLKERVRIAKSVDEIREALEAWLTEDNQEFDVTVTRINDCHTALDCRPNARFHA